MAEVFAKSEVKVWECRNCGHIVIGEKAPESARPVTIPRATLGSRRKLLKRKRTNHGAEVYICKHCGNIIAKVKDTGVPVICCGEPMSEIIPVPPTPPWRSTSCLDCGKRHRSCQGRLRASHAAGHYISGCPPQAGQPAQELHRATKAGGLLRSASDEVEAVYAYCNLHSLWKA